MVETVFNIPRTAAKRNPIPLRQQANERKVLGEIIGNLRKERKFFYRTLFAKTIGISSGLMNDIECGVENHLATVAVFRAIAKTVSCTLVLIHEDEACPCDDSTTLTELFRLGIIPSFR